MATRRRVYYKRHGVIVVTYRAVVKSGPKVGKELVLGEHPTREAAARAVVEYRERRAG